MTIKIDYSKFHGSAYEQGEIPQWTGYLNRRTGEIICFVVNHPDPASVVGHDEVVEFVFDRARIDASPGDWIEIPKISCEQQETFEDREAHFDEFAAQFLRDNNIDGELE